LLIEPEWLNTVEDSGETKGYVIQADLATAYEDALDEKESYLFYSWTNGISF
jgi:hypothetical protein